VFVRRKPDGYGATGICGVFDVRVLVGGRARGRVVVLEEPLSFWGGVDPATGEVIDRRHPQAGTGVAGAILVMPSGRGSSSSSSVLAEAIRAGTAPAGVVLREADGIIALGAIVARELYGMSIPVVVADPDDYGRLVSGAMASVDGERLVVTADDS
jgi:predicted aconitase with swiveling domain